MSTEPKRSSGLRRILAKLGLSCATVVVLLAVLEVAVRWLVPAQTFSPASDLFRKHERADVGYTLRPHWSGYAFGAGLRTNHLGVRGLDWARQKPPGTFRIAVIGDSIAFGYGVEYEYTFGAQLERMLNERAGPRCEVLNFSIPAYMGPQWAAMFHAHVLDYSPDLLIVVPVSNDHCLPVFWADELGFLHRGELTPENQALQEEAPVMASPQNLLHQSRLYLWLKLLWLRYQLKGEQRRARGTAPVGPAWMGDFAPVPISDEVRTLVEQPLRDVVAACKARGIAVLIAGLADVPEYRSMFQRASLELGVPLLELLKSFPEARSWEDVCKMFGLGWDPHPNAEAHTRWARDILRVLDDHKLVPTGK